MGGRKQHTYLVPVTTHFGPAAVDADLTSTKNHEVRAASAWEARNKVCTKVEGNGCAFDSDDEWHLLFANKDVYIGTPRQKEESQ